MTAAHHYIPIVFNLKGKRVLIIGGGTVAERKLQTLVGRGAQLTVVAPKIQSRIKTLLKGQKSKILNRSYKKGDLKDQNLVFVMTDERALNQKIVSLCRKRGIMFNCATGDDQEFLMTSFFERQDLLISVSTRSSVPFLAKAMRRYLEELIDLTWVRRVESLKKIREQLIRSKQAKELRKLAQLTLEQIKRFVDAGEALLKP